MGLQILYPTLELRPGRTREAGILFGFRSPRKKTSPVSEGDTWNFGAGYARHGFQPRQKDQLAARTDKKRLLTEYGLRLPCPCYVVVSRVKLVGSPKTFKGS